MKSVRQALQDSLQSSASSITSEDVLLEAFLRSKICSQYTLPNGQPLQWKHIEHCPVLEKLVLAAANDHLLAIALDHQVKISAADNTASDEDVKKTALLAPIVSSVLAKAYCEKDSPQYKEILASETYEKSIKPSWDAMENARVAVTTLKETHKRIRQPSESQKEFHKSQLAILQNIFKKAGKGEFV